MNPILNKCLETQGFGANANPSYVAGGLKGHTGRDFVCGYGTDVVAYFGNEYVYKVLTKENPANDGSGFTGVFTLVEKDGEVFEFLYGHCNPTVQVGQTLSLGEKLGTESNNGEVYAGSTRITLEMQKAGDTRGNHRHDQKRPLRKDANYQGNTSYLTVYGGGLLNHNGYFYAIPLYTNGYAGCVDWTVLQETKRQKRFREMMLAVRDYQLEVGLLDFKGETDPKKINIGPKTLLHILKDKK